MTNASPFPPAWLSVRDYRGPRFGLQWFSVPNSARRRRLELLCEQKAAKEVLATLSVLTQSELTHIDALARINVEQAESAFRRMFVFNLTLPTGLLFGLAEMDQSLFDGSLSRLSTERERFLLLLALLGLVLSTVFFAFLRSRDARDLADLVAIAKARSDARLDAAV